MRDQKITEKEIDSFALYKLDCGDAIWERRTQMQVMSCIKDAYGCPYIPGSSIKGMLRTILLFYDIRNNPQQYDRIKRDILSKLDEKSKRMNYLRNEIRRLEEECFHIAGRTDRQADMTNDIMSGMIVGDSRPLSMEDMVLCQKVEYHKDGTEKRLNLLRECIKPGTEIHFTLTIDQSICNLSMDYIERAIKCFGEQYYLMFSKKFPATPKPAENTVWLGGGAGYVSKTITYALFEEKGVEVTQRIFMNTLGYKANKEHKHSEDKRMGVSPHILKKTKYNGESYQFGECTIEWTQVS
jgi:CRISPR/Cas system CSM-associated protein Csm5 (group 7 of RAMP superfamily)